MNIDFKTKLKVELKNKQQIKKKIEFFIFSIIKIIKNGLFCPNFTNCPLCAKMEFVQFSCIVIATITPTLAKLQKICKIF